MKTKHFLIPASLALVLGLLVAPGKSLTETKAATGWDYSNPPAAGEVAADSYFGNAWHTDVGSKRLNERAVMVSSQSEWGYRGKIVGDRKFDLSTFSITLDLSQVIAQTGVMINFGAPGSYCDTSFLSVDIIVGQQEGNFMIVVSNSTHNIAIPGFTDGQPWADDANFTGVSVDTTDDRITLDFDKTSNDTSTITINNDTNYSYVVQNSDLYKDFGGVTEACVTIGMFNNPYQTHHWVIESIGDASDEVYFGPTGAFTTAKKALEDLKTLDLSSLDKILEAEEALESVDLSALYSYDKAYLNPIYQEVKGRIDAAIADIGLGYRVVSYERALESFETLVNATEFNSEEAISAYNKIVAIKEEIAAGVDTLEGTLRDRFNAANEKFDGYTNTFKLRLKETYEDAVLEYEGAVATITDYTTALAALELKNAIPTHFNSYLDAQYVDEFNVRIQEATATYESKTTLTHDNWTQGSGIDVVTNAEGGLDCISYGQSMGTVPTSSSGIFNSEKIHGWSFDLSLTIHSLPESTGSWMTFGILEKPEMWIYADDDSVQENKGIFFLVSRLNATTANVQAFLCSLSSNRFYDSPLTQNLLMTLGQEWRISFKEVKKTISGLEDTYFEMHFNNKQFDQEIIAARKIKTVLGAEKEGYFMAASSGYTSSNPCVFSINSINGVSPTAPSIRKGGLYEAPTCSNGSLSDDNTFTCNVDTKGADITSVKVDSTTLNAADYTYSDGKLTISKDFINTLENGTHEVKITTAGGTTSISFLLQKKAPASKGCGGSIIASSAVVSFAALVGVVGLLLNKKRKED